MSNIKTKLELLKEINRYTPIIDDINSISNRIIIDNKEIDNLSKITKSIDKWRTKLKNQKFEVAIIGLEKAGKSTMANSLLNQDYLPNAISRCTFTTAKIESDKDKDEAVINFYTKEEFILRFNALCEKIKLPELDFETLDIKKLNKVVKSKDFAEKPKEVKDIEIMIANKNELYKYINQPERIIKENIQESVRPYIIGEDRSMAVKNITIKSTQLKDMEDIVIYDVPGFDSPTKLHLEQAKKYTDEADVIIMMVSIADRVSFTDTQVEFLNQTAKDGVSLIDKTIVVASKFDNHIIFNNKDGSDTQIQEYMNILYQELKKYNIYREQNIFKVSPRAYLESNGKIEKDPIKGYISLPNLQSVGIDDGFKDFRVRLNQFFKYDALKALNDTVNKDLNNIKNFLIDFKRKHNTQNNENKVEDKLYDIKKDYIQTKNRELIDLVIEKKAEVLEQKDFNINKDLEVEIKEKWIEKLKITDEILSQRIKKISTDGIEKPSYLNITLRKELYKESLDIVTQLVSKVVIKKDKEVISEFKNSIYEIFNITNSSYTKEKLDECLDKIMNKFSYDERSYKPLMTRFINDIFKVLIDNPITTHRDGQRINAFKLYELNIASLLPFDIKHYQNELELGIYEKTLVKKILVQYEELSLDSIINKLQQYQNYFNKNLNIDTLAKEIKDSNISLETLSKGLLYGKDSFRNMTKDGVLNIINKNRSKNSLDTLMDYAKEATTYKEVQQEINKDLDILEDIISNIILDAMMIEKPFLDSLNTQIEAIRLDIDDYKSTLDKFMDTNIKDLNPEEFFKIAGDPKLNQTIKNIIIQITQNE
ncbi:MAG: dynamin family protein [Campylobacterota bacterium]|nr:dynamin family protein [Campylobacterota bacterium]